MPVYLAGYVFGIPVIPTIRFGSGFTVARQGGVGSYRITVPFATSTKFFAPVATSVTLHTIARLAQVVRDGAGVVTFDIEIRDMTTNNPVDGDFSFIALERSGP